MARLYHTGWTAQYLSGPLWFVSKAIGLASGGSGLIPSVEVNLFLSFFLAIISIKRTVFVAWVPPVHWNNTYGCSAAKMVLCFLFPPGVSLGLENPHFALMSNWLLLAWYIWLAQLPLQSMELRRVGISGLSLIFYSSLFSSLPIVKLVFILFALHMHAKGVLIKIDFQNKQTYMIRYLSDLTYWIRPVSFQGYPCGRVHGELYALKERESHSTVLSNRVTPMLLWPHLRIPENDHLHIYSLMAIT